MAQNVNDALKATNLPEPALKNLAKKIRTFESSLSGDESRAYHAAMKNAVDDNINKLFSDPGKKKELESYLRDRAGVQPSEDQPGSITSVVVTVAVHC